MREKKCQNLKSNKMNVLKRSWNIQITVPLKLYGPARCFFFLIRTHCTLHIANSNHYKHLKYKRECKTNCHNLFGQVRMPPENMKIMRNNYSINKTEEKIDEQNNCKFKNLYRPIFNVRPVDSHLIEIDYLFRKKNMSVSQAKRNECAEKF